MTTPPEKFELLARNAKFWRDNGCPVTAEIVEFLYPQVEDFLDNLVMRIANLEQDIYKDSLASPEKYVGTWQCPFCSFADTRAEYIVEHERNHHG